MLWLGDRHYRIYRSLYQRIVSTTAVGEITATIKWLPSGLGQHRSHGLGVTCIKLPRNFCFTIRQSLIDLHRWLEIVAEELYTSIKEHQQDAYLTVQLKEQPAVAMVRR